MSDEELRTGDYVRVVFEGPIEVLHSADNTFMVGTGTARNRVQANQKHVKSVKKIAPPVTVFQPGDTVRHRGAGYLYSLGVYGYFDHTSSRWYVGSAEFTSRDYELVDLK